MVSLVISGACGRMGKVVAQVAKQRNDCKVVAGIDQNIVEQEDYPIVKDGMQLDVGDVIIDFSHPQMLEGLLSYATIQKKPLVIATTGYSGEQMEAIREASKRIPIFFSFNMSLGVNLLAALSSKAAQVLGEDFDIEIVEKHHNQKVDAPSGTAYLLADAINHASGDKYYYVYDRHDAHKKRDKREIGLHAVRGGTIVGEHDVIFAGQDETLVLSHRAQSREIFACGAVNAALFLARQKPGLYSMEDLLKI